MISLLLLATTVQSPAPPIAQPRPATSWSCEFNRADASEFVLEGTFAEAPAGTDPNSPLPTTIQGDAKTPFVGAKPYQAFESSKDARVYMVHFRDKDDSAYTLLFSFLPRGKLSIATITRYIPEPATGKGKLHAYATGFCKANFHPIGYKGPGQ